MDECIFQFVLPNIYRNQALKGSHNDIRCLGVEKYLDLLRDKLYWPMIAKDMKNHVKQCDSVCV